MAAQPGRVVVGVDETRAARAALEFALEEGLAHGCVVEVVTTWLWSSPYAGMEAVTTLEEGRELAAAVQDRCLGSALGSGVEHPATCRTIEHAPAGQTLVERSRGARMLVVGSSRKGSVTRAVLGSVSEYCVRHATAPVVVVAAGAAST